MLSTRHVPTSHCPAGTWSCPASSEAEARLAPHAATSQGTQAAPPQAGHPAPSAPPPPVTFFSSSATSLAHAASSDCAAAAAALWSATLRVSSSFCLRTLSMCISWPAFSASASATCGAEQQEGRKDPAPLNQHMQAARGSAGRTGSSHSLAGLSAALHSAHFQAHYSITTPCSVAPLPAQYTISPAPRPPQPPTASASSCTSFSSALVCCGSMAAIICSSCSSADSFRAASVFWARSFWMCSRVLRALAWVSSAPAGR